MMMIMVRRLADVFHHARCRELRGGGSTTSVELIGRVRLTTLPVHRKFTDPLIPTVDLIKDRVS